MAPTATELKSGLAVITAVADTIRELKEVPSGTIYAGLIGRVTFEGYTKIIAILVNAGLVKKDDSHLLHWIAN